MYAFQAKNKKLSCLLQLCIACQKIVNFVVFVCYLGLGILPSNSKSEAIVRDTPGCLGQREGQLSFWVIFDKLAQHFSPVSMPYRYIIMIEALTKMDTYIQLYILLFRQKDFDVGIGIYSHKIREGSIVGTVQCTTKIRT